MPVRLTMPDARARRAHAAAFTLAEMVIVIAMVGIAAAIAVPRYAASISRFRAESGARRIEADLKYAQAAARASSASRSMIFNVPASTYGIGQVRELDVKGAAYTVSLPDLFGCRIAAADFGGDTTVRFDGYGKPDSGGTAEVRCGGDGWSVTLEAESGATKVARMP